MNDITIIMHYNILFTEGSIEIPTSDRTYNEMYMILSKMSFKFHNSLKYAFLFTLI